MAVSNLAISVGTTSASTIVAMPTTDYSCDVRISVFGANPLFLGTVSGQGFPIAGGGSVSLSLQSGEVVYGIATGGTADVRVLTVTGSTSSLRRLA
jgi:hypothetical protein